MTSQQEFEKMSRDTLANSLPPPLVILLAVPPPLPSTSDKYYLNGPCSISLKIIIFPTIHSLTLSLSLYLSISHPLSFYLLFLSFSLSLSLSLSLYLPPSLVSHSKVSFALSLDSHTQSPTQYLSISLSLSLSHSKVYHLLCTQLSLFLLSQILLRILHIFFLLIPVL